MATGAAWRASVCARRGLRVRTAPFPPVLETATTTGAASTGNVCVTMDSLEMPVEKEAVRTNAREWANVWTASAFVMKATLARIAQKVNLIIADILFCF